MTRLADTFARLKKEGTSPVSVLDLVSSLPTSS